MSDFTDYTIDETVDITDIVCPVTFVKTKVALKEIKEGLTLPQLIEKEDVENPEYVTVTINDEFVSRDDFEKTAIQDGDEILYFMGGDSR